MKHPPGLRTLTVLISCGIFVSPASGRDVRLVKNGQAKVTIYTPVKPEPWTKKPRKENTRPLLAASVNDLAMYLAKMTGAEIDAIVGDPPDRPKSIPILIGELGEKRFGPPSVSAPAKQGHRLVVTRKAIACIGESDLATSYAIYEILDRLGCRWYLPGEMGEVVPRRKTISLPEMDVSRVPATLYRSIWYAGPDFKRRNRLGGLQVQGAHGLEGYISAEQREAHPDWNAERNGKRPPTGRICWGNPEVAQAVAETIITRLDKVYRPSVTLSPADGTSFCECKKCKALDAGDWDPTVGCVSLSDRMVHFANQIAERVTAKYPDVLFGLYAYVQYTRPPIREKPHPNVVIALAPITYCRAHSMLNADCPSRQAIQPIVKGWGKVAKWLAFRGYLFNLAEVNAPYPMMRLWSDELPTYYANKVRFWMPESMPTFEGSLPGIYLNIRIPWYPDEKPDEILNEFFTRFYGAASAPMRRYWYIFDDAWTKVPEHAGNVFGHGRRFTPEVMKAAREAMNEAMAASQTVMEFRRVKFADYSLRQFELFMKMRWDLANGKLRYLERDGNRFLGTWASLGDEYRQESAFGRYQGQYFGRFFMPIYRDGSRVAKDFAIVTRSIRKWKYQVDREKKGEKLGWDKADFKDQEWKTTDPSVDTWSSLGLFDFFGSVWYRTQIRMPAIPEGKKVYLWLSCADSVCRLFVNGRHIPYVNSKGETVEHFIGYSVPGSFEVTSAIRPGAQNQITIKGSRPAGWINELGTGGLMGPVLFYREK